MMLPSTSMLVIVDSPAIAYADDVTILSALKVLFDAAALFNVPSFVVRYSDRPAAGLINAICVSEAPAKNFQFEPTAAVWRTTILGKAIADTNRKQLIVSGLWLEEAVTLLALKSLATGLDTFIPIDATAAVKPTHAITAQARLTQAGAVPTSCEQVLREWAALSGDSHLHGSVDLLLSQLSVGSS